MYDCFRKSGTDATAEVMSAAELDWLHINGSWAPDPMTEREMCQRIMREHFGLQDDLARRVAELEGQVSLLCYAGAAELVSKLWGDPTPVRPAYGAGWRVVNRNRYITFMPIDG